MLVKVVGAKRWKGSLEGKTIDSAKLFAEVRMDDSRNGRRDGTDAWAGGIAFEEIKLQNGLYLQSIESHVNQGGKFPVMCELSIERVSNGKTVREVVTEVRVVDQATGEIRGAAPRPLKAAG